MSYRSYRVHLYLKTYETSLAFNCYIYSGYNQDFHICKQYRVNSSNFDDPKARAESSKQQGFMSLVTRMTLSMLFIDKGNFWLCEKKNKSANTEQKYDESGWKGKGMVYVTDVHQVSSIRVRLYHRNNRILRSGI